MKKQCLIIIILTNIIAYSTLSAQAPLLQNVSGRKTRSLDGVWQSQVDVYGVASQDRSGLVKDRKPIKYEFTGENLRNTELVEQNLDVSEQLQVPGDWNTQRENLFFYEGNMWYRKKISITPQVGKRYFLHFGAVNYEATVYLNGAKLGQHEGGFTAFQFEVTSLFQAGENKVLVNASNIRGENKIPTKITDWWNYGGITRSVNLIEVPETYIADYFIQLEKGKTTDIKGWVKLEGSQKNQNVTIEIPEIGVKQALQTDTSGYAPLSVNSKKLQLWTPENPKLLFVKLTSSSDTVTDKIGFRTIETRGTEILLNGKHRKSSKDV